MTIQNSVNNFQGGDQQVIDNLGLVGAWQPITLAQGWVNFGSPYATAQYCTELGKICCLRGVIKGGTISSSLYAFTLPVKPLAREMFNPLCSDGTSLVMAKLDIDRLGNAIITTGANGYLSLSNIRFFTN